MEELTNKYRAKLERNTEKYMKSKQTLISRFVLPFLEDLNWDVDEPKEVEFDYETGNYSADIALLNKPGLPFCLMYVVKLYAPREAKLKDLKTHCKRVNSPGILTDGFHWIFVGAGGMLLHSGHLIDSDSIDLLRMLRRENFGNYKLYAGLIARRKLDVPLKKAWDFANKRNNLRKILKEFKDDFDHYVVNYQGEVRDYLTEKYAQKFLKDYLNLYVTGGTPDAKLIVKFPDNQVITHQYGKNVLINCIRKLGVQTVFEHANYRLKGDRENGVYLISEEPPNRSHEMLKGENGKKYYIQTGDPNKDKEKYLRYIRQELQISDMEIIHWTL